MPARVCFSTETSALTGDWEPALPVTSDIDIRTWCSLAKLQGKRRRTRRLIQPPTKSTLVWTTNHELRRDMFLYSEYAFRQGGTWSNMSFAAGNLASASATLSVIEPSTITGPTGSSSGSGCFIATAAYGSWLAPEVVLLRSFRDQYLLTNPPGQWFVDTYYRYSPPIAALIETSPELAAVTRALLAPLVCGIKYPFILVSLLLAGLLSVRLRRNR